MRHEHSASNFESANREVLITVSDQQWLEATQLGGPPRGTLLDELNGICLDLSALLVFSFRGVEIDSGDVPEEVRMQVTPHSGIEGRMMVCCGGKTENLTWPEIFPCGHSRKGPDRPTAASMKGKDSRSDASRPEYDVELMSHTSDIKSDKSRGHVDLQHQLPDTDVYLASTALSDIVDLSTGRVTALSVGGTAGILMPGIVVSERTKVALPLRERGELSSGPSGPLLRVFTGKAVAYSIARDQTPITNIIARVAWTRRKSELSGQLAHDHGLFVVAKV
nr:hypothetical protein CFP56_44396 [Quercus suber]